MTLILRSIGHLLVVVPLNFFCVMNINVLPLVIYFIALLIFVPMNIALLPFSLCSDAPLASMHACFDGALFRANRMFSEKYNVIMCFYRLRGKLLARYDHRVKTDSS